MRKVRIRTILEFRCAKLRLALCAIHPRISLRQARISAMRYTFPCEFVKAWPCEAIQLCASIEWLAVALRREVSRSGSLLHISVQDVMRDLASVCVAQLLQPYILQMRTLHPNPRFICAIQIVVQNPDPRFVQRNPRMVQIRALRITYMYIPSSFSNDQALSVRSGLVCKSMDIISPSVMLVSFF